MSLKSQSNLRTISLQYLENEPLNVLKLIVDRFLWIEMIEISFFNIFWQNYIEKDFYNCIAIPWKWVAPSMSLKSHSNARKLFFDGFKNELRHLCPLNRIQIFEKIHCNTPCKWTTEYFKTHCGQNFMDRNDRNLIFQHILTKIYWKNFYNCIAIPWKWVAPSMSLKPQLKHQKFLFRWVRTSDLRNRFLTAKTVPQVTC